LRAHPVFCHASLAREFEHLGESVNVTRTAVRFRCFREVGVGTDPEFRDPQDFAFTLLPRRSNPLGPPGRPCLPASMEVRPVGDGDEFILLLRGIRRPLGSFHFSVPAFLSLADRRGRGRKRGEE